MLMSEKKGVWGAFHKAGVIGTRLHFFVSLACIGTAFYLMFS